MKIVFDLRSVQTFLLAHIEALEGVLQTLADLTYSKGGSVQGVVLCRAGESSIALRRAMRRRVPDVRLIAVANPFGTARAGLEPDDASLCACAIDNFVCDRLQPDVVHSYVLHSVDGCMHGDLVGRNIAVRSCSILRQLPSELMGAEQAPTECAGFLDVDQTASQELSEWLEDHLEDKCLRTLSPTGGVEDEDQTWRHFIQHYHENVMGRDGDLTFNTISETQNHAAGPVAWFPAGGRVDSPPTGEWIMFNDCLHSTNFPSEGQIFFLQRYSAMRGEFDRAVVDVNLERDTLKALQQLAFDAATTVRFANADVAAEFSNWALSQGRAGRDVLSRLLYAMGGYTSVALAVATGWRVQDVHHIWNDLIEHSLEPCNAPGATQCLKLGPCDATQDRSDFYALVRELSNETPLTEQMLGVLAACYVANARQLYGQPRLLVDVSEISIEDVGTGIQRVVHNIAKQFIDRPPLGYRLEFVRMDMQGRFVYARHYCSQRYLAGASLPDDDLVEPCAGDIFFGLDLSTWQVYKYRSTFDRLRDAGVEVHFLVHDLLPVMRPDYFQPEVLSPCRAWYAATAELADGIVCVSQATAKDYMQWLRTHRPIRKVPIRVGVAYPGVDLGHYIFKGGQHGKAPRTGYGREASFLMVGTIVPRKGHEQVIAAMELLWSRQRDVELTIIGRQGWMMDELAERIRQHPESGRRLHWLENAGDDQLKSCYQSCDAVIMASEGEGFGLPIIEAGLFDVPIILRDIPVFREVAGEHGFYFSGYSGEALASSLEQWISARIAGALPHPREAGWRDWAACRDDLENLLIAQSGWDSEWWGDGQWVLPYYEYIHAPSVGRHYHDRIVSNGTAGLLIGGVERLLARGSYYVRVYGECAGTGRARIVLMTDAGTRTLMQAEIVGTTHEDSSPIVEGRIQIDEAYRKVDLRIHVDIGCEFAFHRAELEYEAEVLDQRMRRFFHALS